MIKSSLKDSRHFLKIRPDFEKAFKFLKENSTAGLQDGKYSIDGEKVYAVVARSQGRGIKKAGLEAHRQYIDIQYVVEGKELIGIRKLEECKQLFIKYKAEKDIVFYADKPEKYLKLKSGDFAVFFPSDAHAPLAGKTPVHKIVIKIMV